MPSRAPRGPYAKSAETQQAIVRAALEVVEEKGHRALTTAEVSERAGVSEATRFYHFPTRDHLLVAALRQADADAEERSRAAQWDDLDIAQVPRRLVEGVEPGNRLGLLFIAMQAEAADPDHPAHAYFLEHQQRAVAAFADGIRRRQAAGLAQPDLEAEVVARQLLAVWRGLAAQWVVSPSFDLDDELEGAFRRLSGQGAMEVRRAIDELMAKM